MLLAHDIVAIIHGAIRPRLSAPPVLLVLLPVPCVLRAVHVSVYTLSIGLIVEPIALVHIAVRVNEAALAVGLVLTPLALVERAIGPDLLTLAFPLAGLQVPLADVDRAILKFEWGPELEVAAIAIARIAEGAQLICNVLQGYCYQRYLPRLLDLCELRSHQQTSHTTENHYALDEHPPQNLRRPLKKFALPALR